PAAHAALAQRARRAAAERELRHAREPADGARGRRATADVARAELAAAVVAPAGDRAPPMHGAVAIRVRGDGADLREAPHGDGRGRRSRAAIAELPLAVVTPADDAFVGTRARARQPDRELEDAREAL